MRMKLVAYVVASKADSDAALLGIRDETLLEITTRTHSIERRKIGGATLSK